MNINKRVVKDINTYFAKQISDLKYKIYRNKTEINKLSEENKAYKKLVKQINSLKDKFKL